MLTCKKKHVDLFVQLKTLTSTLLIILNGDVLWPTQPDGVMSSAVSLLNHTFTGQA